MLDKLDQIYPVRYTAFIASVAAMTLAWLSPTSLGLAVVPEVRIRIAGASRSRSNSAGRCGRGVTV